MYNEYAILTKVLFTPFTFGKLIYSGKEYKFATKQSSPEDKFDVYILTLDDIRLIDNVKNGSMSQQSYDYFINPQYIVMNMTLFQPLIDVCNLLQTNTTLNYSQLRQLIDDKLKSFDNTDNNDYSQVVTMQQLSKIIKTQKLL